VTDVVESIKNLNVRRIEVKLKLRYVEKFKDEKPFEMLTDVDKTDIKQVNLKEKVIRKYIWMLRFHNSICEGLGLKQLLLPHQYGCDMNNLRLIVKSDI